MSNHNSAAPVTNVPYFTPGTILLCLIAMGGLGLGAWRFVQGLGVTTNLDNQFPWGLWIAVDVATGVALAAGGFTTAALVHVLHRERYHAVLRAALLTAMLGYTFVALGLMFDLGRFWNVWRPMFYWQGNSVLFEVGMCVMCYLTVLYLEFLPIIAERMREGSILPKFLSWVERPAAFLVRVADVCVRPFMWLFILLGIVLSCMHQSSLGSLMLIAPTKLHALWYTPILPLLFLMSAVMVGFPMVIFESLIAARSFRRLPEMDVLGPLARFVPITLGLYLLAKLGDMAIRESWRHLFPLDTYSIFFLAEVLGGVALPLALFLLPRVRRSVPLLFLAAALVVLGVALNRVNVFIVGYSPPYAVASYFPSPAEFGVTAGLIALLVLVYRAAAKIFPVIEAPVASEVSR